MEDLAGVFEKYDDRRDGTVRLEQLPNLLVDLGRDMAKASVLAYLKDVGGGGGAGAAATGTSTYHSQPQATGSSSCSSTSKLFAGSSPSASSSSPPPLSARSRPTASGIADNRAGFEDVIAALKHVEEKTGGPAAEKITTPLALMRRLEQYRKQCEIKGDYSEARKARTKYDELRFKESVRQRRLIEQAQVHEMSEVEAAQKQQLMEFSAAWDRYMADYESTAYMSLEKLKEQHAQQFSDLTDNVERQPRVCKFSPDLLELRRRQKALGKQGQYEEAAKVKEQADRLEKYEIAKYASQSVDQVQRQEQRLRAQQNKALNALLKRIQRDRSEQLRQRGVDSRRLCQRNKNLRMDLEKKQHFEFLRAEAAIKAILGNAEQAEKLLEAQDSSFLEKLGIVNGGLKDPSVS
eukprot:CAMPEP_0178992764 /NCGR_PEP_ID=MMETSP0795-20121207/6301_1 /TAXON_ID=88552 /ORGANISM="Amoebophrya sp., Strain Ameob2" /LENGTH=406 /DNA_ID=CAMNT_0020684693 /DNA_START=45 /DNA_END=1266 /DNA_ORIENTATION=-